MRFILLILGTCVALAGCVGGPEPRYEGPSGDGALIYRPGVGITRRDAVVSTDEQVLFAAVEKAFNERRWQDCILGSLTLSQTFPESSRVVEAILLRIRARMEYGRNQNPEIGLPSSVPLNYWMFLYLAPIHDDRLVQLMARDAATREYISEVRDTSVGDFVNRLVPDADALYRSGQLDAALFDCRILLTYYLPAMDLRTLRAETAELTRDVAWLTYAARDFSSVVRICDDLEAMSPGPSIKGDSLFIRGQAQRRNGAHALAANTFGLLYSGAGLRDTDTRWRPYALMWQINETMEYSKGWRYDLVPYERAMELLGEYELYMIENPNIPAPVHAEFIVLMERVYNILARRELDAADTYSRLGEDSAVEYHTVRASEWEKQRDQRIEALRAYDR